MSWKIESFSSEILKRKNARSSKYQVHSARAHITVSSVLDGCRNMLQNAFSVLTEYSICFCKGQTFFSFNIISKTILLKNVLNMHTQLQGIESILKVVWIVNHQNKFITRLHSCIIFVIFLDIRLEACSFTKNEPPNRYFSSILSAISPGNCKSCYF